MMSRLKSVRSRPYSNARELIRSFGRFAISPDHPSSSPLFRQRQNGYNGISLARSSFSGVFGLWMFVLFVIRTLSL